MFLPYYSSIEIIGNYLRFTFIENRGIAFGIDTGDFHIYVTALTIFAILILFYHYINMEFDKKYENLSLSLIIGGAIGNAIDRILVLIPNSGYNGVIDFIDVGINDLRWYVFNIADTSITIGAILYILAQYKYSKKDNVISRNI
tara:strand:+ start:130 stop:561 length:432 start_codon:yes stop_codon:yes gene_type:complete